KTGTHKGARTGAFLLGQYLTPCRFSRVLPSIFLPSSCYVDRVVLPQLAIPSASTHILPRAACADSIFTTGNGPTDAVTTGSGRDVAAYRLATRNEEGCGGDV